jgi:excisionase family DNA binding protein
VLPSAELQISDFICPTWARLPAPLCCSEVGPRLGPQGQLAPCNDAPQGSSLITCPGATRHVGDHQARAIRLKDAGRRQKLAVAGGFPDQSPLSHNWRREMTNELDRLLTITDLSEMLGVPVDTLYGWRHRGEGPAGYRIGRHVRYRREAVEAWLDTQADQRQR